MPHLNSDRKDLQQFIAVATQWKEKLPQEIDHLVDEIKHGLATPEVSTSVCLVHPVLRHLGYDPENREQCLWEGSGIEVGKRKATGSGRFDGLLRPVHGNHIPVEVKPITMNRKQLGSHWIQLAHRVTELGGQFGILTNSRYWLVYQFGDRPADSVGTLDPIWEIDLLNCGTKDLKVLANLGRTRFNERGWAAIQEPNRHKRLNKRNPLIGATVLIEDLPDLVLAAGHRGQSGYLAAALRKYGPHLESFLSQLQEFHPKTQLQSSVAKWAIRTRSGKDEDLLTMAGELPERLAARLPGRQGPRIGTLVGFCAHLEVHGTPLPQA